MLDNQDTKGNEVEDDKIIYYHSDQSQVDNSLGLGGAADSLAEMALQVSPPFSIAVSGKWGSGKTSLMRRAFITLGGQKSEQAVLLGEDKVESVTDGDRIAAIDYRGDLDRLRIDSMKWQENSEEALAESLCVWFSPWQHQNAENPIVPLLLEVRNQFTALHAKRHKATTVARKGALAALTLLERVGDAAMLLSGTSKRPLLTGTTKAVHDAWQSGGDGVNLGDGQRFHLLFEDAIETALLSLKPIIHDATSDRDEKPDPNARLIIFIDDLDRCEESTVVSLLESIKLYLSTSRCVFVLGLDNNAILKALGNHWSSRSEDHNREYLEKLFQAIVKVPSPNREKIQDLVEKQLLAHGIPQAVSNAEVICNLIEPNPRKVKNFTNSLCAAWRAHDIPPLNEKNSEVIQLILFQYLALYHPSIWRILERQPWSLKIMFASLSENINDNIPLPDGFKRPDQHMMEQFFSHAFNHVIKHESADGENKSASLEKHRGLNLDKAIDLFLDRIDRKHSDEMFIIYMKKAFTHESVVKSCFLTLGQQNMEASN